MSGKFVEKHQSIEMSFDFDKLNIEELKSIKERYDRFLSEV